MASPDRRRFLGLPHRAMRSSAVNRRHAWLGGFLLLVVVAVSYLWRTRIWLLQVTLWHEVALRFGISAYTDGTDLRWYQAFYLPTLLELVLIGVALLLTTWLLFRSTVVPAVKGFFVMIVTPIFLYQLVLYLTKTPPNEALTHIGPEWLWGELFVPGLETLLYAVFLYPLPMQLSIKFLSHLLLLCMTIVWRTATPIAYVYVSQRFQGLLSVPAWMVLGPWTDFLYIVPMFATTLALGKGGRPRDYRS
ncbi:MAG: hypothetical protein ACM3XM_16295 [Mycobacterium leprae]